MRRSARGCLAIYVWFSTEIQSAGLRGRRPFAHLVRARLLKGCNAIAIVVLALAGVGCGFEREAAAPAPPGDPASYGCAVNMAIPMTVVPSRGPDEPFLSVPTPSGWEFIARDKEQVRGALASVALRSQDFTPNAVITLADVSADYATPQQAIDGEQLGLAGEVHIDATQDGTLCGYPARTVNYLYEGRHATTLIVAGTDARKRTWISTVGIQCADPSVAGFAEDKALILNNFQFLIRHLGDIAT